MKQLVIAICVLAGLVTIAWADTYRWVDDQGVIHFTDNPDRIPAKYHKRVQETPSPAAPEPTPQSKTPEPPPQRQLQPPPPDLPGGLSEQAWRSRFSAIRAEIKALQDGLPAKREAIDQLRRKRIIYQRLQDRTAYNAQNEKIGRDEARISELQAQLSALDAEASRAGVPLEWRK